MSSDTGEDLVNVPTTKHHQEALTEALTPKSPLDVLWQARPGAPIEVLAQLVGFGDDYATCSRKGILPFVVLAEVVRALREPYGVEFELDKITVLLPDGVLLPLERATLDLVEVPIAVKVLVRAKLVGGQTGYGWEDEHWYEVPTTRLGERMPTWANHPLSLNDRLVSWKHFLNKLPTYVEPVVPAPRKVRTWWASQGRKFTRTGGQVADEVLENAVWCINAPTQLENNVDRALAGASRLLMTHGSWAMPMASAAREWPEEHRMKCLPWRIREQVRKVEWRLQLSLKQLYARARRLGQEYKSAAQARMGLGTGNPHLQEPAPSSSARTAQRAKLTRGWQGGAFESKIGWSTYGRKDWVPHGSPVRRKAKVQWKPTTSRRKLRGCSEDRRRCWLGSRSTSKQA